MYSTATPRRSSRLATALPSSGGGERSGGERSGGRKKREPSPKKITGQKRTSSGKGVASTARGRKQAADGAKLPAPTPPPPPPKDTFKRGHLVQFGNGPTWVVDDYLAHGAFGTVYKVHSEKNKSVVAAVKVFNEEAKKAGKPAIGDLFGFYYTHDLPGFPVLLDPVNPEDSRPLPPMRHRNHPFLVCTLLGPSLAHAPPAPDVAPVLALRLLNILRGLHESTRFQGDQTGLVYKVSAPARAPE